MIEPKFIFIILNNKINNGLQKRAIIVSSLTATNKILTIGDLNLNEPVKSFK